jgi:hypothetical protein
LTPGQIAYLDAHDEFVVTSTDGPRPGAVIMSTPPAVVTLSEFLEVQSDLDVLINDGAALDTRLSAVESVVDPDGIAVPGGLHVTGDNTNKVGYLGYFSNVGAGMETYRGDHATRAGEFRFIFGGDTDSGSVKIIHSNDAQTYPEIMNIGPAGVATAYDVEVTDSAKGVVLKSPDGTRYRVTVANGGTLTVAAA